MPNQAAGLAPIARTSHSAQSVARNPRMMAQITGKSGAGEIRPRPPEHRGDAVRRRPPPASTSTPPAEMLFQVSSRHIVGQHAACDLVPCPDDCRSRSACAQALRIPPSLHRAGAQCHPIGRPHHHGELHRPAPAPFRCGAELLVELHQVDRQLRITREEHLLSQHQATQALIRGLAHEIKNPLGGLRGAAQLLERGAPGPGLARIHPNHHRRGRPPPDPDEPDDRPQPHAPAARASTSTTSWSMCAA